MQSIRAWGGVDVGTGSRIRTWLPAVLIVPEVAHAVHGTEDTRQGRLSSDLHEPARTAITTVWLPIQHVLSSPPYR